LVGVGTSPTRISRPASRRVDHDQRQWCLQRT
jgi:hypothetical protein